MLNASSDNRGTLQQLAEDLDETFDDGEQYGPSRDNPHAKDRLFPSRFL